MYLVLQQEKPDDYVIATGRTTSVRDFVRMSFAELGVSLEFKGKGVEERGYVSSTDGRYNLPVGKEVVCIDPRYFRPTEVDLLIGDATKAKTVLGWEPKHSLTDLVKDMVTSDMELMKQDEHLHNSGFKTYNYHE